MSGTSFFLNQVFNSDCKSEFLPTDSNPNSISGYKKSKENTNSLNSSCRNGVDSTGSQRLVDETDLKELLHLKKCKAYNRDDWAQNYAFPRLFLSTSKNENHQEPFILQPSLFHRNNAPPTIYFNTKVSNDSKPPIGLPKHLQCYLRWKISSITPNSIRNCVSFMKFDTIRPSNTVDSFYVGSWCKHMLTAEFDNLDEWRKVNHYPGSFHLGRKDKLWFRLRLAHTKFSQFDNLHPTTFVMPKDYDKLCEYWNNSPSKLFIVKPPASARGNGIRVINDISEIPPSALESTPTQPGGPPVKKSTMIVQQYISNPCLLENGQKFDLRIYVLLTSVDPLRIYVHEDGLVRFASSKYTSQEDGIIDQFMHLTNYFINKNNHKYQINNDCDSLNGCKWTLKRFWRYLREHYTHVDVKQLRDTIIDLIIKTIICCEGPMTRLSHLNCKNDYTSYELFGFDIILDENFKPWILEVNITPSLKSESDLDTNVKYGVIKDMFNLVGYNLPPIPSDELSLISCLVDCKLFFDKRYYAEILTKRDKLKQSKFQKLFKIYNNHNLPSSDNSDKNVIRTQSNIQMKYNVTATTGTPTDQSQETTKVELPNGGSDSTGHIDLVDAVKKESDEDEWENMKSFGDNILNDLTQNDIRVLMLAEDELSRCGHFKRVFPAETSSKYLQFFDKPRYYNLLLDAWEHKYKTNRLEGISRLSNLATFMN